MIKHLAEEKITNNFRETLCELIKANNCKNIAEIGIWKGELSRMILEKCKPESLILVDPLSYELNNQPNYTCTMDEPIMTQKDWDKFALEELTDKICSEKVIFHRMTSLEATKLVEDESLDFVFIDGMHTYEAVKEDIKAWLPKIKKGGILSGDDYRGKHAKKVQPAVDELLDNVTNIARTWFVEVK